MVGVPSDRSEERRAPPHPPQTEVELSDEPESRLGVDDRRPTEEKRGRPRSDPGGGSRGGSDESWGEPTPTTSWRPVGSTTTETPDKV